MDNVIRLVYASCTGLLLCGRGSVLDLRFLAYRFGSRTIESENPEIRIKYKLVPTSEKTASHVFVQVFYGR
jgi:hypothetical protein